ncbi:hypothetical protein EC991_003065 [Linnemannia zychae]|nr:hypothetical protein EC991_003065 [Linnemannia zychae]
MEKQTIHNVYEGAPATHVFHEFYAQSEASSQYSALTVPGGQARVQLKLPVEGENDNFSDRDEDETESVAAAMETINITGSSSIGYIQSSIGGNNNPTTKLAAIRAADAFFESVAHNNNGSNNTLNRTQPADKSPTPPRSISGSESGASHSEGSTPPSSIDTATANGATAATAAIGTGENGETPTAAAAAAPEPDEISIPEATSSWAAIFRTLGDLQERFNLAPEETVKMFTEITQST